MDLLPLFADEQVKTVLIGTLIALGGSTVRGIDSGEPWRALWMRLLVGVIMGGIFCYILNTLGLPAFVYGSLAFTAGFRSKEVAAKLSKYGLKKTDDLTGKKEEDAGNDI